MGGPDQVIGKAMGKAPEADQGDREGQGAVRRCHGGTPRVRGRVVLVRLQHRPRHTGRVLPDEQRVAMVRGLGLQVDPIVNTLPETEGTDSALIGRRTRTC
ncbi:hypothetical protein GS432_06925 [Rhodococcus hoagii]|nr:hypothetical protein [Prescottella equi]